MKMTKIINCLLGLSIIFSLTTTTSMAQGGPGGGNRPNPAEMVAKEKQMLMDSIPSINEDQKVILDVIYTDYETEISNLRANASPDNREAMRTQMRTIRDQKNESLKAILTEEQYKKYNALMKTMRDQAGPRRGSGGNE